MTLRPDAGHVLLILDEVSRPHTHTHTHNDAPQSVGLLWTSDQLVAQHSQQTSMPPAGFEPTISTGERPQTHALNRVATGTDRTSFTKLFM